LAYDFSRIDWHEDRAIIDGVVLRIEYYKNDAWELGNRCFSFYKNKYLIDEYEAFFAAVPAFGPMRILELGVWDGGSAAFWFQLLQPEKFVGIDIADREDSAYFRDYVDAHNLSRRLKIRWRTSQSDRKRLLEIVKSEFDAPLDLVFDDGSHRYEPTSSSLSTILPLIRPGGFYIVEDWPWKENAVTSEAERRADPGLVPLISDVLRSMAYYGSKSESLVSRVLVWPGFVAIERSATPAHMDWLSVPTV
jgi:predicted O-methyltransferase YrrM